MNVKLRYSDEKAVHKSSYLGGKPSSNFVLTINNKVVDLGNERSPLTTPSFKNTLSEGDKSSLAFAFFLAKLESDPGIYDPISSLDNHQKSYTADQVMRYSALAKQVFVLTHETFFARALIKFADTKNLMTQLCIKREGLDDSTLDTWDIEKETRSDSVIPYTCRFYRRQARTNKLSIRSHVHSSDS